VSETIAILARELGAQFGITRPRIAVCGLNPHAGEGGHLGREDIDVIAPALEMARARGTDVTGPLPADTVFVPAHARGYDAIVAMYHDQGLPALKAASFGLGVNVTLGLPFPRTSVDHGTALDLAGSGRADAGNPRAVAALADLVRVCVLAASLSPVGEIVAGRVVRPLPLRPGVMLDVRPLLPDKLRIGMQVRLFDADRVAGSAVVADIVDGVAAVQITQATVAGFVPTAATAVQFLAR